MFNYLFQFLKYDILDTKCDVRLQIKLKIKMSLSSISTEINRNFLMMSKISINS